MKRENKIKSIINDLDTEGFSTVGANIVCSHRRSRMNEYSHSKPTIADRVCTKA